MDFSAPPKRKLGNPVYGNKAAKFEAQEPTVGYRRRPKALARPVIYIYIYIWREREI